MQFTAVDRKVKFYWFNKSKLKKTRVVLLPRILTCTLMGVWELYSKYSK